MKALNRLLHTIESKIVGRLTFAYHRTKITNVNSILKDGLKPSDNGLYGPGLYMTYELEDQLDPYMRQYGNKIIKYKINVAGFLFFDHKTGVTAYGKDYSLMDMLVPKICSEDQYYDIMGDIEPPKDPAFASAAAAYTWMHGNMGRKIRQHYKGIQYIGSKDGHCLLIFKPEPIMARPLAIASALHVDEEGELHHIMDTEDLKWSPLKITQKTNEAGFSREFRKKFGAWFKEKKFTLYKLNPSDKARREYVNALQIHATVQTHNPDVWTVDFDYYEFNANKPFTEIVVLYPSTSTKQNLEALEDGYNKLKLEIDYEGMNRDVTEFLDDQAKAQKLILTWPTNLNSGYAEYKKGRVLLAIRLTTINFALYPEKPIPVDVIVIYDTETIFKETINIKSDAMEDSRQQIQESIKRAKETLDNIS